MDYRAATKVSSLMTSLTDSKASSLDEAKLKELKGLLKTSDELVSHAHGLITDRLEANHSQTRKLALQLCDILFARSKTFRRLLTAQFGHFVELTVGHKSDKPLPAPPAAAIDLRQKALEAVEKWHEQWGLQYPQVTLAYKYLKKHFKFPGIASRAAAAAAAGAVRRQRHQQMLQQRYETFQQDFPQQQQQMQSLLRQMQECFELLKQPVQQLTQRELSEDPSASAADHLDPAITERRPPAAEVDGSAKSTHGPPDSQRLADSSHGRTGANSGAAAAGETDAEHSSAPVAAVLRSRAAPSTAAAALGDKSEAPAGVLPEQEWEDVAPAVQQRTPTQVTGVMPQATESEPVAAAAAADADGTAGDYDLDELVGDFQETVPDPAAAARQATVLEQLADLAKQAQLATSRTLLDWLRLLTQLQLDEQRQQQQRQHLRAVVDLRSQLQAALQEAANWDALPAPRAATNSTGGSHNHDSSRLGNLTHHAAASTPASDDASIPDLGQLPSRGDQPLQLPQKVPGSQAPAASAPAHIAFASGLRWATHQQPQQQQPQQADVYAGLQDPTAAGRGIYILPNEVRQAAEEGRWVRPQHSDSSESEQHLSDTDVAVRNGTNATPARQGPGTAKAKQQAAQQQPAGASGGGKSGKGLDAALRQKLAAAAPKLPIAGEDWLLAQHGVSSHGMELYNHWGAVDSTTAIPQDRLKELVGYTASYYKPSKKRQKTADPGGGDLGTAPAPAPDRDGATHRAAAHNEAPALSAAGGEPASHGPASAAGGSSSTRAAEQTKDRVTAASTAAAASGGARLEPVGTGEGSKQEQHSKAASQRESASAHNRAVLAGAHSDEAVAAALQQQLNVEAAQAQVRKGRARKTPETKADKLRKKLLGSK